MDNTSNMISKPCPRCQAEAALPATRHDGGSGSCSPAFAVYHRPLPEMRQARAFLDGLEAGGEVND